MATKHDKSHLSQKENNICEMVWYFSGVYAQEIELPDTKFSLSSPDIFII